MTVEHHHSSNLHSSEPHSTAHSTAGHSTAAHSTDNALNHVIIEFYEKLSSWEHAIVRDKGFSLSQVHTIELLGVHGAMRMKELADKIGVTTGTLTVQIDKMVEAQWVVRRPHETDRRSILVELTEKGQALFLEHDTLHLQLTTDLTAKMSSEERIVLLNLLSRMNNEF
ncbi:MarR family transcriptional regulator [Shewanella sp. PP-He15 brown]